MGGPPTPAVGWAAGIERLAMLLPTAPAAATGVAVIPLTGAEEPAALGVLQSLRTAGIRAEIGYRGTLKRRLDRANRGGARTAVLIGPEEQANGTVQLKDLGTGEQHQVPLATLADHLR